MVRPCQYSIGFGYDHCAAPQSQNSASDFCLNRKRPGKAWSATASMEAAAHVCSDGCSATGESTEVEASDCVWCCSATGATTDVEATLATPAEEDGNVLSLGRLARTLGAAAANAFMCCGRSKRSGEATRREHVAIVLGRGCECCFHIGGRACCRAAPDTLKRFHVRALACRRTTLSGYMCSSPGGSCRTR